ncbi:MAG: ChbG/HpnK family deacetylase [Spirochaetes bacterium]|nr:ChbG/HpnK family deacetylase [Spirochaetota bacterium]
MKKNYVLTILLLLLFSCIEKKTQKLLILNVDDVGTSPDTIEGVIELYKNNSISSVSFMAFGEDFENSAAKLKEYKIPTGVHLALNHGSGVLPVKDVPSLHRPDGMLWNTVDETMSHLVLEEVRMEFEAQIKKLSDSGVRLTHLDSHMGLVFNNQELLQIYIDLARKYNLAVALPASTYFDKTRKVLEESNLQASSSYDGIYDLHEENIKNRTDAYRKKIRRLSAGVNYMYSHPMPDRESVRKKYDDYNIRINDFSLFMSKEWKKMLKENNVELVSF